MKILSFVDLHGDILALKHIITEAKKADMVVCAGDISNFEQNLKRLISQLASTGKPTIMVHGNHESAELLKEICDQYDNMIFLHAGVFQANGISFIGFGGGGFSKVDKEFERFAAKASNHLKGKIVLVTHAPPYKTMLDNINGEPCGNKSIRNFIMKERPKLAVCGHLHENAGLEDFIGPTRIINPGKKGKMVNL